MKEEEIKILIKDPIVKNVIEKFASRSNVGVEKYNTNLTREDLSIKDWLTHLQEELMDACNYIEVLKQKF